MHQTVTIPGTPSPPCAWTRSAAAAVCRPLHLRSDWEEVSVKVYPLSEGKKKKKKKKTTFCVSEMWKALI